MKKLLVSVLAAIVASLTFTAAKTIDSAEKNAHFKKVLLPVNSEYIDFNTAKINGKLNLLTKTNQVYQFLGKPDSIIVPDMNDVCSSFYDKKFRYAYIKGVKLEVYGDTAVVSSINFKKSPVRLISQWIALSENTTLADIKKVFPNAFKDAYKLEVVALGETTAINIAVANKESEDSWLLLFQNRKLVRMDLNIPCGESAG